MADKKSRSRSRKGWLSAGLGIILCGACVLFSTQVQTAVRQSITYCLTSLVPSLFPFMAITGLVVSSGSSDLLGRILGGVTRIIFRLPHTCSAVILMGCIGGYPAGAKGIALLLERGDINKEQASRMLLFCVNPGLAFVVTFLGGSVLGDLLSGWILFFAVTLSSLMLGVLCSLSVPMRQRTVTENAPAVSKNALVNSINGACRSTLMMCGCILAFAAFSALIKGIGLFQILCQMLTRLGLFTAAEAATVLSFLLEVTGGVGAATDLQVAPSFFAFGLAFGGLCVHLQIFSLFQEFPCRMWRFFAFRFLHGLMAVGVYQVLEKTLRPHLPVLLPAAAQPIPISLSGTWAGGLSMVLMCAAFLLTTEKALEKRNT